MPRKGVVPPQFKKHPPPSWRKLNRKSGKGKYTPAASSSMANKRSPRRRTASRRVNIRKKDIMTVGVLLLGAIAGYEIAKVA